MKNYSSTPPVVMNLIALNALFFLAQTILPRGQGDWITNHLALYYPGSENFRAYQYVTHMFLHGDMAHIFFNMFSLWMFGRTLEYDLGGRRFLLFYMITGVGAALFYTGVNYLQFTHAMGAMDGETAFRILHTSVLGASGAIYGVLMAFGILHPNVPIMLIFLPIPIKAKYFVVIFMALEFVLGLWDRGDGIAHFAHLGGMIFGFLLLRLWKRTKKIYY